MKGKKFLTTLILTLCTLFTYSQGRMRVIMDNDFAGDPDGLFALAQLVLSPSVETRGIIGSHLHNNENWTAKGKPSASTAADNARMLLKKLGKNNMCTIVAGSEYPLADTITPIASAATELIINEALQCTKKNPLFILCGGGLTEIASAWMLNPQIADRIVLVWIGGAEYPGYITPPGSKGGEYNTTIDIHAAQVVFNRSNINIWQIPRNAYRECLISRSILQNRLKEKSGIAPYLVSMLDNYIGKGKQSECYVLGDSPLVLVSALQSNWERDACSSTYTYRHCPVVDEKGMYHFANEGRQIKVFDHIDTYLMFEDMFAKFILSAN